VQFSQGVIPYFCKADRERNILQLSSFQSTVNLVVQDVELPVAASLEVSVVKQGRGDPLVHFDGKITAGTTKNYREHMVLYDSSVPSSEGLLGENGSLVLNRDLVAVNGYVRDPALEDEKLVLYVCFLDAGCVIKDEDAMHPAPEDDDDEEDEEGDDEDEVEEDPKNVVTLKYPQCETVWEYGCTKLKVKVDWTAILDKPKGTDFSHRHGCLPRGYTIDYRLGIPVE